MKLFLTRKNNSVNAVAEYDMQKKTVTVLKGSRVSATIAYSSTFRGAASIEKSRLNSVKDRIVIADTVFKSASTAANFVTGASTNGMITWKTAEGKTLKQLLAEGGSNEQG